MKANFFLCFFIPLVLIGCDSPVKQDIAELPVALQDSITIKLESIALNFLKSWEPPYDPDAALSLFTQREDFHLVISAGYTCDNYMEWIDAVHSSMHHEKEFYNSYKHEVKYIETVVLSPKSGVVMLRFAIRHITVELSRRRMARALLLLQRA